MRLWRSQWVGLQAAYRYALMMALEDRLYAFFDKWLSLFCRLCFAVLVFPFVIFFFIVAVLVVIKFIQEPSVQVCFKGDVTTRDTDRGSMESGSDRLAAGDTYHSLQDSESSSRD